MRASANRAGSQPVASGPTRDDRLAVECVPVKRHAEAGFYESPWGKHPRIQLRTIRELLDGKGIDYPHVTGSNVTHRRAQRARTEQAEALPLFGAGPVEEIG